jgi:hypothetical protein
LFVPDAFRAALDDLADLPRQFVEQVVRSIPHEWDVSPSARTVLIELIAQRAQYLARDRSGIMGIHLYQGQLDLPAEREDST